jgi:hypothetical protein
MRPVKLARPAVKVPSRTLILPGSGAEIGRDDGWPQTARDIGAVRVAGELRHVLLFVTVAVAVSSVVHLAARRAVQAALAREEAASLLELAQTVLGGADSPQAVLETT